jgi:hypothetical protein
LWESQPALVTDELAALAATFASTITPWPPATADPTGDRHYELWGADDDIEAWAIYWPPGIGVELHDHGDSAGPATS